MIITSKTNTERLCVSLWEVIFTSCSRTKQESPSLLKSQWSTINTRVKLKHRSCQTYTSQMLRETKHRRPGQVQSVLLLHQNCIRPDLLYSITDGGVLSSADRLASQYRPLVLHHRWRGIVVCWSPSVSATYSCISGMQVKQFWQKQEDVAESDYLCWCIVLTGTDGYNLQWKRNLVTASSNTKQPLAIANMTMDRWGLFCHEVTQRL